MKRRKGHRYILLVYRQAMDRLWHITLPFAIIMLVFHQVTGRYWPLVGFLPAIPSPYDAILFITGIITLVFTLFAWVARSMAYIQARENHLRLVTPFLVVKISYRRVRSIHPSNLVQLFPPQEQRGTQRRNLERFYGMTALVMELYGYPMSPRTLRLVLGSAIMAPETTGFVLLVPDWMALSTEIESFMGTWRQAQSQARRKVPSGYDVLQSMRKKK
jgi:uncharacterized membrane protein SirB2